MGILEQLEIDYDLDITNEFMTHLSVMTVALEPLIIGLNSEQNFPMNLQELFRIFSNVHSAAKFLKLEDVERLTKLCMNLIGDAMEEHGDHNIASTEFIDWMLLAADQLNGYQKDLEYDSEHFRPLNPTIIKIPQILVADATKKHTN